jgi:hypothetical protein
MDRGECPAQRGYAMWFAITSVHPLLAAFPTLTRVVCCPSAASLGRVLADNAPQRVGGKNVLHPQVRPLRVATRRSPGRRPHRPDGVCQLSHEHHRVGRAEPQAPALVRLCRVREAVISWLRGWALEVVEAWARPGRTASATRWRGPDGAAGWDGDPVRLNGPVCLPAAQLVGSGRGRRW